MHLAEEVICQSAVVIEATEVGTAHVADLELLVSGRPPGLGEVAQHLFRLFLLELLYTELVEFLHGQVDHALFAHDLHL